MTLVDVVSESHFFVGVSVEGNGSSNRNHLTLQNI